MVYDFHGNVNIIMKTFPYNKKWNNQLIPFPLIYVILFYFYIMSAASNCFKKSSKSFLASFLLTIYVLVIRDKISSSFSQFFKFYQTKASTSYKLIRPLYPFSDVFLGIRIYSPAILRRLKFFLISIIPPPCKPYFSTILVYVF